MKIIVTGGAGFIGSNFIYMLLDERSEWQMEEGTCGDYIKYCEEIYGGRQ